LRDSFDALYAEGADSPKMMSVGMHCRLLGRPGRIVALQKFMDYSFDPHLGWVRRPDSSGFENGQNNVFRSHYGIELWPSIPEK
jgi:hypothetical protein